MNIAKNQTIAQWTDELSSNSPTPGGGGVGALVAALGVCLASMVANLTVNKESYKDFSEECCELILQLTTLKVEMLSLVDEDALAFKKLIKTFKTGGKDEDYAKAAKPAENTVYALVELLNVLEVLALYGNKALLSDVGAAASCAKASFEICRLNIVVNLKYIKQPGNKMPFDSVLEQCIPESIRRADNIYRQVVNLLE